MRSHFERDIEQRIAAHDVENFVGDALHDARARIVIFVDAVAEAHQLLFAGFHALDVRRHVVDRADIQQHAQHCFVGAAVQRAIERGGGRGGGRITDRRASCPRTRIAVDEQFCS